MSAITSKVKALFNNGRKIVLIRHCKTNKAAEETPEADKARTANEIGKTQCESARTTYFKDFLSADVVCHTEAGRTKETAELLFKDKECKFHTIYSMYGGLNSKTGEINCEPIENAFWKNGYQNVQVYLDLVGEEPLQKYTDNVLNEVLKVFDTNSIPEENNDKPIIFILHAVYIAALTRSIANCLGDAFPAEARNLILTTNVGEVSGFVLSSEDIKFIGSTIEPTLRS